MSRNDDRGRAAESPGAIPKAGWKDIALRVKDEMSNDNLSMAAPSRGTS
jgi:membrane protein